MSNRSDGLSATLTINGRTWTRPIKSPLATLASVLRAWGWRSVKVGCEAGDCGSCTVLLDGEAVCSCLVPVAQAEGASVLVANGDDPVLAKLHAAFAGFGAAQCGACSPGMVMAAAALLNKTPSPTHADVETAIGGVLCRCTGYAKIIEAVLAASRGDAAPSLPPLSAGVGAPVARADGIVAARGELEFGDDVFIHDGIHLRIVRSPHARARFRLGDLDAFARAHRLEHVFTARDVPGRNAHGIFPDTKDQPVFAVGHVRYRGEAVAAIAGSRSAVERVDLADFPVTWEPLDPVVGIDAALAPGAPVIHASHKDNVLARGNVRHGDIAACAGAAANATGTFETSFVEHAYIETEAGTAERFDDVSSIHIRASTQAPTMDRDEIAAVLGIKAAKVAIVPTACGGGFGGKLDLNVEPFLAIAATRWHQRKIRLAYSRTESMAATTKRHPARIEATARADAQGRLVSFEMTGDFDTGAYASWGPTVANRVPIHAHGPYKVPHVWNRTRAIYTNGPPSGAFRGFGVPQAAIAHEALMDDLAEQLKVDRWHIRRINALARGDTTATGQVLASGALPACLDALEAAWTRAVAEAEAHNTNDHRFKRGAGIACMWYGCGNTSLSNPSEVDVGLAAGNVVTIATIAQDIGQGISTILPQIVREALAIEGAEFRLVIDDGQPGTADGGKTSASRQTFVTGNAARLAALDLRGHIERMANVAPGSPLRLEGSVLVASVGSSERRIDLVTVLGDPRSQGAMSLAGRGRYDPETTPLDENGQGIPYATYGFAAQIAEVEVDTALGTTKVLHIHAAHDVGRAINPMLVEGQIHGGIAQGLGLALMEEYIPGRTENLHDYLIPTAGDIPLITTHIIEDPDPAGPFGAKGVGEPALIATAPAILSAIRHATGVTIRRVPVLPHRLWEALQDGGSLRRLAGAPDREPQTLAKEAAR